MANPRGLRAESGNSLPSVTVENRMNIGVFWPLVWRKLAFLYAVSNYIALALMVDGSIRQVTHVLGALKMPESATTTWMYHA